MNVISGVSVVLYEPPANRQATGRKFIETAKGFYPWDTEPVAAINNPDDGAEILYGSLETQWLTPSDSKTRNLLALSA